MTLFEAVEAWASACEEREASVGTYLMKQLMHWEALLEQYDAMEHRCTQSIELYSAEVKRRDSKDKSRNKLSKTKTVINK